MPNGWLLLIMPTGSLLNYRNLVNYYTRKNISVSYLRAKKKNDTDRVLALYGSADERYW